MKIEIEKKHVKMFTKGAIVYVVITTILVIIFGSVIINNFLGAQSELDRRSAELHARIEAFSERASKNNASYHLESDKRQLGYEITGRSNKIKYLQKHIKDREERESSQSNQEIFSSQVRSRIKSIATLKEELQENLDLKEKAQKELDRLELQSI